MTNVLRQKSIKCFEWTVQPSSYLPLVSDTFPIQDRKCFLELKIGTWVSPGYGASNLNFKSNGKLQSPVTITVRVPIAPEKINSETRNAREMSITCEYQQIWGSYCGDLLNMMLTFEVIIHVDSLTGKFFFFFYKISTIE